MAANTAASGVRFTPGEFAYNGRVAVALVPALAVAAALGGRVTMAVLTVGAMLWYILDAMSLREGSLSVGWGTLLLANVAMVVNVLSTAHTRAVGMTVLVLLTMGAVFLLAGMWLTLQFRWIQMQHPAVILAFERQVLTASLPVAGAVQALGIAALADPSDVPYYLAAVLSALYALMGRPLVSSFHAANGGRSGGARSVSAGPAPREALVQSRADAALMALVTVALPAASYVAIHSSVLAHWLHFWSVLLLASAPAALLSVLPGGLWWLPGSPLVVKGAQKLLLVLSALGLLAGFEGRVVFYAFTPYIKLSPPWSYIVVTAALLGLGLLIVAHLSGALGTGIDVTVAGSCLLLCTTGGAVAAGVPLEWLPAPLVAAVGLALYYDSRSVREYAIFVVGALLTAAWFISHHFWFLDARVGHLRIRTACQLALAALLPALAIPGLIIADAGRTAVGVLLFIQAELVCVLEEQMYSAAAIEGPGAEQMYPGWLVIATSAAGAAAAQRLAAARFAPDWVGWVVPALYVAKLSMLLVPEAHVVLPIGLLLLAAVAPIALHPVPYGKRRVRIQPWQGLAHAAAITIATALARFAVFDIVQWATMGRPHEGMLLGVLLIVWAAALAPLATHCYGHNQTVFRATAGVGLLGAALALLQPPLPHAGGAACPQLPFALCPRLWDARHVPMHEADDAAIWGSGLSRREHWTRWLLVAAAGAGLIGAAAGGSGGSARPAGLRLLLGAAAGGLVGGYLALEAVPGQESLQTLVMVTCVATVCFITLLQNPLLGSPGWLPLLGVGWAGAAALALLMQAALPLPDTDRFRRLYPDSSISIEAERRAAVRTLLVGIFSAQAALLAFTIKLRVGTALSSKDPGAPGGGSGTAGSGKGSGGFAAAGAGPGGADFFCGTVPGAVLASLGSRAHLPGTAGLALRRLQRDGLGWAPTAGNITALLAYAGGLWVSAAVTGGAPEPVLLLAPLLLLLGQDPYILSQLGEEQRYVPPIAAVSGTLTAISTYEVFYWSQRLRDPAFGVINGALLLMALPMHAAFLRHMWQPRARPLGSLAAMGPLCLLALLATQLESIRFLGGVGVAEAALMFFDVRAARQRGMKVI